MQTLTLNDGHKIPQMGLGTWKLHGKECTEAVSIALENGYRHIDTAFKYQNHDMVGRAITESTIKREDIYVTTKIWRDHLKPKQLKEQLLQSLNELQTHYVDMLLIHWPNKHISIKESFNAMNDLKDSGRTLSIGVSNFTTRHLEEAMSVGFIPAVNQVEFHPSLYQEELWHFCKSNGIQLVAYSPLAQGKDMEYTEVNLVAKKHDATAAQILIAWILHKGIVAIPRSNNAEHIKENIAAAKIQLDNDDMQILDGLNEDNRLIEPPFAEF